MKKVSSLRQGALKHGGATKYNNGIYSNIPESDNININDDHNRISIFIPDTVNINEKTDNSIIIQYSQNYIKYCLNNPDLIAYQTKGSWYSDDIQKVVYDNITIITVDKKDITEDTINIFIMLARYIKKEMNQEAVTISINNAICIV